MEVSSEEKKLIFNAIRYWQMYKAPYEGKEYKSCEELLNRLSDGVSLKQKVSS